MPKKNSVIGNFIIRLCTWLISMAVSRSNKLGNKAEVKSWKNPKFFKENPGTNQKFITHVI